MKIFVKSRMLSAVEFSWRLHSPRSVIHFVKECYTHKHSFKSNEIHAKKNLIHLTMFLSVSLFWCGVRFSLHVRNIKYRISIRRREKRTGTHTEVKWCAKANETVCVRLYVRDVNGSERVRDNMNMWVNEIYKYL